MHCSLKRNVYLLCWVSFLQGMVFYGPIATLYRLSAGISVFQITLIESISLALCVVLELPWGIAADRIGYKNTMLVCTGLYFLSKIVFWRADGFAMFLLERVMLSVVIAGISGVDVSILYLSCEPGSSQRIFGIYNALNTGGLLLASGVYALFIGSNYRLAGFLTVISYGLAAGAVPFLREVRPAESRARRPGALRRILRETIRDRRLLLFLIGTALLNEAHQTITVFLSQLQYVRCGMGPRAIGGVCVLVTLAGLTGVLSHPLTKRLGFRRGGAAAYLCCIAACAALALTRSALLSAAAVLALRIAFSLFQPLQTELQNRRVTAADRATALSVNALLLDGTAIATNLIYGAAAERALPLALLLGAGSCALGLGLYLWGSADF